MTQRKMYQIASTRWQEAFDRRLEATAISHALVHEHDPAERQELLALRATLVQGVRLIDRLMARDDHENGHHARQLEELRSLNGLLEPERLPAA